VTRTDDRYIVDSDDCIVTVVGHFEDTLGPFLGHSLWEANPQAERLFAPHFAEARRTGREVEFTSFYAGRLARRRVVPIGQTLTVYATPLEKLNVRTLGTLSESLLRVEAELAGQASEQLDPPARASLRALP
jgi:hypothetical protein